MSSTTAGQVICAVCGVLLANPDYRVMLAMDDGIALPVCDDWNECIDRAEAAAAKADG